MIVPDILATIRFYSSNDGGRRMPVTREIFTCPFKFENQLYDCGIFLKDIGCIYPGETKTVPVKFLSPDLIKPRLKQNAKFYLWDGRDIAEGIIDLIY